VRAVTLQGGGRDEECSEIETEDEDNEGEENQQQHQKSHFEYSHH
jgi:hypothetical protein